MTSADNYLYQSHTGSSIIPIIPESRQYVRKPWEPKYVVLAITGLNKPILGIDVLLDKASQLGFPQPSADSLEKANSCLNALYLKSAQVEFINPIEDGGVSIEFSYNSTYHNLEVFNDGDVYLLARRTPHTIIENLSKDYLNLFVNELG